MEIENIYAQQRKKMVQQQLMAKERGIVDKNVLKAMSLVPRHQFVEPSLCDSAYMDQPLSIGENQTISQPFMVAYMSEILKLSSSDRVLEIGTGCGYQTAILAEIVDSVYTVEIIDSLAQKAEATLSSMGYKNIYFQKSDGNWGWPEHAPFDKILVACAPPHIPESLKQQLAIGGTMIIPVDSHNHDYQNLILIKRITESQFSSDVVMAVRFVPMTGAIQKNSKNK